MDHILIDQSSNHIRRHGRDINKMLCFRLGSLPPLSAIIWAKSIAKYLGVLPLHEKISKTQIWQTQVSDFINFILIASS